MNCERKYIIWFHSYRYKCDFEYFRICLRDRLFNLKRGWEGEGGMLCFFPKKIFWCWIVKKKTFLQAKCTEKYSDARFSPRKITFFWLQGRNHSCSFKLRGRSLTRFHYYIFFPGYRYNSIFKLLLGFIEWNCRHNARHIITIPFLLPPDWDGLHTFY